MLLERTRTWERQSEREHHTKRDVGGSLKRRREPYKSKGVRKKLIIEGETE